MINIDDFHSTFFSLVTKDQSGDSMSPEEFNRILWLSMLDLVDEYYSPLQTSRNGVQIMPSWEEIDRISDTIGVWLVPKDLAVENGKAAMPEDYYHFGSLRILSIEGECKDQSIFTRPIKLVRDSEFAYRSCDPLVKPTLRDPIAQRMGFSDDHPHGYLLVAPNDVTMIRLHYIRYPKKPVWGYTFDPATTLVVYDPNTSVDIEFRENMMSPLIKRMAIHAGIILREDQLYSYIKNQNG